MEVVMTAVQKLIPLIFIGLLAPLTANGQSAADIAGAVLPLPEDLRADATVYTYDDSGNRVVLKQGSNFFECQPLDVDSGFTRCAGTAGSGRRDLSAKLSARGLEGDELQAELTAAENRGEIAPRLFGTVAYRTYNKPDRIQLLMVISLPGATAESLGAPTGRQRDNALAGKGRPWMMRPGTSGAHLMIPINGTDLSNQP
jgi:hypothetical protein